MARRRYSDQERAEALAALAANRGNTLRTAEQLGIPEATLRGWVAGRGAGAEVADLRDQKKEALADRLEALAHQLVDAAPDKITTASLQAVVVSLGIAVEKMRLLREQPTAIEEVGPHEQFDRDALEADLVRLYPAPSAAPDSAPARSASDAPRLPVAEAESGPALSGGPLAS